MASVNDILVKIGLDAAVFKQGIAQIFSSAGASSDKFKKAMAQLDIETAKNSVESARLAERQSKQHYDNAKKYIEDERKARIKAYLDMRKARDEFYKTQKSIEDGVFDSSAGIAKNDSVKNKRKQIKELQKELKDRQKEYNDAVKEQGRADKSLRQANSDVGRAESDVKTTGDAATRALEERTKKANEYEDAAKRAGDAQEKLIRGEHLKSAKGVTDAQNSFGRIQEDYDKQLALIKDYEDKIAKAKAQIAEKSAAQEDNSKANKSLERGVKKLTTLEGKLADANTKLGQISNSLRTAKDDLLRKQGELAENDAKELKKLQDAATSARTALMNADEVATQSAQKRRDAEENLRQKIVERKAAEARSTTANENVTHKKASVNTAQEIVSSAVQELSRLEAEAKKLVEQGALEQAQKLIDKKAKVMEQAAKRLETAQNNAARAKVGISTAKTNTQRAELRLDTAQAKGAIAGVKGQLTNADKIARSMKVVMDNTAAVASIQKIQLAMQAIHGLGEGLKSLFSKAVAPGYEYEKQLEGARISIAGIYASMTKINGEQTTFTQGLQIANGVVNELTKRAAVTAATPTDLVRTFQGLAGPGLGEGMSTNELMEYTVTGVNAAKAFQLPATQFIQELRDMVQGGIQPASSTIATALGLSDKDIKKMQNSSEGLFKSLMARLKGFSVAASAYADTMTGKQEILKQSAMLASAEFTKSFEVEIKSALDAVTSLFADVNTKTGEFKINPAITDFIDMLHKKLLQLMQVWGAFDADTGQWYPGEAALSAWENICNLGKTLVGAVEKVADGIIKWSPAILGVVDGITSFFDIVVNTVEWFAKGVDHLIDMGKELLGISDTVNDTRNKTADIVLSVMEWLAAVKVIKVVSKGVYGLFKMIGVIMPAIQLALDGIRKVMKAVLALEVVMLAKQKLINAAKKVELVIENAIAGAKLGPLGALAAAAGAGAVLAGLDVALDSAGINNNSKDEKEDADAMAALEKAENALADTGKGISDSVKSLANLEHELAENDKGVAKEEVNLDKVKKLREETFGQNRQTNEELMKAAQADKKNKDDEKENKKRLQNLQKHLKQINKQVDNRLKEALQLQKEHMEQVELTWKKSQMTMDAYYREKASDDKVQAEAQLKALQEKKANIEATEYAPDKLDERNTELEKIEQEMQKYTRQLQKATVALEDIGKLDKAFKQGYNKEQNGLQAAVSVGKWDEVRKGLISFGENNGWDKDSLKLIVETILKRSAAEGVDAKTVAAIIQQESGGHQSARGADGEIGLMQLMPGTANAMGVDPYDVAQNVVGGIKYFAEMLRKFNGNVAQALAAYNGGPGGANGSQAQAYSRNVQEIQNKNLSHLPDTRALSAAALDKKAASAIDVDKAIDGAIESIRNTFGESMHLPLATQACVQAATMMGAWYDEWLAEQFKAGVVGVPALVKNARNGGPGVEEFNENNLKKGDIIVYRDPSYDNDQDHVVIYTGNGMGDYSYVGNSSGANDKHGGVRRGKDYRQMNGLIPQYIIKTGDRNVGFNNVDVNDKAGLEYQEEIDKMDTTLKEAEQKTGELWGQGLKAKLELIKKEYEKKIKEANKFPADVQGAYIGNLMVQYQNDVDEAIYENTSKNLEWKLKALEDSAKFMEQDVASGKTSVNDAVNKYYKNFYGANSPITGYMDTLVDLMAKYQRQGNLDAYWKVKESLQKIRDSFNGIADSWVKAVQDHNSWRLDMLEADWTRTTGQKEQAREAIENNTHSMNAVAYGKKIDNALNELRTLQDKLTKATEELLNAADDETAKLAQSKVDVLKKEIAEIQGIELPALQQSKQLEEALGHNLTLLEKVRKTAKQSLEDGLYTFLTDSVNEAQSLEEALSNLALTILKSLQQMFAKQMVNQLMNMWFPNNQEQAPKEYDNKYDQRNGVWGATSTMTDDFTKVSSNVNDAVVTFDSAANRFIYSIKKFVDDFALTTGDQVAKDNEWTSSTTTTSTGEVYDSSFGLGSSPLMRNSKNAKKGKTDGNSTVYTFNADDYAIKSSQNPSKTDTWMTDTTQTAEQSLAQATQSTEHLSSIDNKLTQATNGSTGMGSSSGTTLTPTSTNSGESTDVLQKTNTNIASPEGNAAIADAIGSSVGQLAGSLTAMYSLFTGDTKERLLSLIYLESQLIWQQLVPIQTNIQQILTAITAMGASTAGTSGTFVATGGYISGPGTSTSDSIPAQLSNGEFVVKAASVQKYGRDMLERINNGSYANLRVRVPHFATGGYVGSTGSKATGDFAASFGATVSPRLSVNNYVDGKRIFDSYGRDVVRSEVRNTMIKNAKFFSETLGRMR